MVETVSTAVPPVNYKPNGSSYSGTASSTVDTDEVYVGDKIFDEDYLSFEGKTKEEIESLLDAIARYMSDFEYEHDIDLSIERTRVQDYKAKYITDDYKKK